MGERMTAKIYALCDPRIADRIKRIRYIGLTCVKVSGRVSAHKREAVRGERNLHKGRWINQLLADNLEPACTLLCTCEDDFGPRAEALFHNTLKAAGAPLCNLAHGERVLLHHSEETKRRLAYTSANLSAATLAKRSASLRGRTYTPETIAKMSAAAKARGPVPRRPDTGLKISAAKIGKPRRGAPISAKAREKIRKSNTGKKHSPETIALLRGNKNGVGHKKTSECKSIMQGKSAKKLTLEIADEIRRTSVEYGLTQRQLAIVFGVSQPIIGKILRNEMWKHWELVS